MIIGSLTGFIECKHRTGYWFNARRLINRVKSLIFSLLSYLTDLEGSSNKLKKKKTVITVRTTEEKLLSWD